MTKTIMVGVTGGIAAFKAAALVSQLTQKGYNVQVLMTHSATKFITPLTMQVLSHNPVAVDLYEERDPKGITHIDLADQADLFVIAPTTANTIGKMAHGVGDDLFTSTLLATKAPIVIAPAMNVNMYTHPAVLQNLETLMGRGVYVIHPDKGQLACGHHGEGRMAEPQRIMEWIETFFEQKKLLKGKHVLITAGPTIEPLDPVRFFSNYSSGKMGYALAEEAVNAGAEVTLVSGPVKLSTPRGVQRINIQTAREMSEVVMGLLPSVDIIIKTAAVADYSPMEIFDEKIKKNDEELVITLQKTIDIAAQIGQKKTARQFFVGFAAETENMAAYAMAKREKKGMDLIVANNIKEPGAGFHTDTNIVTIFDRSGEVVFLPKSSKHEIAKELMQLIGDRIHVKISSC